MYVSLGQDISPVDAQIKAIATYVAQRRWKGIGVDQIRSELQLGLTPTTRGVKLSGGHPCSGPSGQNVCDLTTIEVGIHSGAVLYAQQKEASSPLSWGLAVLIVGGSIAIWTQLAADKRPRRRR